MAPVTTYGRYMLNKQLPEGYQIKGETSKKELKGLMNSLAREAPSTYVKTITKLKREGDRLATTEGLTVGLDDIEPQYTERNRFMTPLQRKFRLATTDRKRSDIAIEAQRRLTDLAMKHPGSMTLQVKSGARGNPTQYTNSVGGVGYSRDPQGDAYPWLIEKSYAEGLSPADYWSTTNQSMMDVIRTFTMISEPGELSKKLVNSMSDLVITEDDCGTHNGILMPTTSADTVDRYVAKDVGHVRRNTLMTPTNQPTIARSRKKILMRSPMTCEAADGVCRKCQGLDEKGQNHVVGINVGVRAAQAMAEPLTQFALNARHGGRTLLSDKHQVHGIAGLRQITETPRQFVNKATLAEHAGRVSKLEAAPQGGNFVYVDKKQHYVAPNLGLKVKKGDAVEAGDILSEGIPKPDEVVRHKGLGAGRLYMVDTLKKLYEGQGKNLDSRHYELLAKSNMNHVRILEDPTDTFIKGDVVGYNTLQRDLSKRIKQVPLRAAIGETLGRAYYHYAAGTRVTPAVSQYLRKQNVRDVMIAPRAPKVEFVMKPLTGIPKMHPDWMARLAHRGLKSSILQAAHTGEVSNIHGTHPVPSYAFGVEFGKGESGRY